jgi:hypothetical protein
MTADIIAGAIIIALALIVAAIWVLGSRAKKKLAAQYPPPGEMVDVGGFRMHIDCQGDPAAGPAVVMDSGNGEPAMAWASVLPGVAQFARACAFDRPGLERTQPQSAHPLELCPGAAHAAGPRRNRTALRAGRSLGGRAVRAGLRSRVSRRGRGHGPG